MIMGQDISGNNPVESVIGGLDFIWIKATEGTTFVNPLMTDQLKQVQKVYGDNLPIIGFYHYCRAEKGDTLTRPKAEAKHFIETIKPHIGKCLIACDYEGKSFEIGNQLSATWVNRFCEEIERLTGVKPFIYSSASMFNHKRYGSGLNQRYPRWIAHYTLSKNKPDYTPKDGDYIWQFSSNVFNRDLDIWTGDRSSLAMWAF